MDADDERFEAKTTVLIESVTHHIGEEEQGWFPKLREALGRKQLQDIGARMEALGRRRHASRRSRARSRRRSTQWSADMRLRRSDPTAPGYRRRRHGRGFDYLDQDGRALSTDEVDRCRQLVIPPAWTDVWICADPAGHIQAVGVDAAGRRQYLYHPEWRARRDRHKFAHVLEVAERLPRVRRRARTDLGRDGLGREQVLALATRLLDQGLFRVGGDESRQRR